MAITDIQATVLRVTGVTPTANSVEDAQRFVVSKIPKDLLLFAMNRSSSSTDGSAIAIENDSIIDVQRNEYSCKEIPLSESKWANDSTSLKKATAINPVFWVKNDGVQIAPNTDGSNAGYVFYISYPEVDDDSDLRNAVIFHTSANEFEKLATGKTVDWSDLVIPVAPALEAAPTITDLSIAAVPPDVPSLSTVTFTSLDSDVDASLPTYTFTALGSASTYTGSAPSYTKPTLVLASLSSISDLSISSILPVAPSLSSSSVSFSTSAPSYVAPVSPSRTAFNDYWTLGDFPDSDPDELTISAIPPVAPVVNADSSTTGGAEVDTGKLATAPTYIAPVMAGLDFTDANTWVNTEEDPEMVSSRMQVISGQIGEFSAKVQDSMNTFNKENAEYQAKLQIALQDAAQANSGDSTLIGKFSSELSNYQAIVSKEVQEYQQRLSRYQLELGIVQQSWAKEEGDKLQKYQADIQNELNNFNKSNTEYQAQLQISIQNAQLDSQDEAQELQNYASELQSYQSDVNKQVQEFTNNVQKNIQVFESQNNVLLSQYQSDIQNELNEFNKENVAYQSAIQESTQEVQLTNQKNLAAAEGELRLNIDNENRSQQRQLQNGINDMQAIIQNNDDLMQKYSAELQQYQSEVATEVQEFQQNLEGDLRVWQAERQTDIQKYSAELQKYQAETSEKLQKVSSGHQNASYYSQEAKKYYDWALGEINMYIQNNSKMINTQIAAQAQAAAQQRR